MSQTIDFHAENIKIDVENAGFVKGNFMTMNLGGIEIILNDRQVDELEEKIREAKGN